MTDPRDTLWKSARRRAPERVVYVRGRAAAEPPPPPPVDVNVYASWQDATLQLTEDGQVVARVRLSEPLPFPSVIPIIVEVASTASSGDYTLSTQLLEFAAQQEVGGVVIAGVEDALVEGSETLLLTIDPDETPVPVGDTELYILQLDPRGIATVAVEIEDSTVIPTPEWRFITGGLAEPLVIPEGGGPFSFTIGLNSPATDQVQIRVQSNDDTALAGTHYVAVDEIVTIEAGQSSGTFEVELIDDQVVQGTNLLFNLTGTIVSGNVADGSNTQLDLEIDEDDVAPPPTPVIQWTSAAALAREGVGPLPLYLEITPPLATQTNVPVTVTGTAEIGTDYTVPLVGGELVVPANTGLLEVPFNALAGDAPERQETAILTLEDGAEYDLGTNDEITVTIEEEGAESTPILVTRGIGASRVLVEGLAALPTPSPNLPSMTLDGEACQVIGMDRDDAGDWLSVWYAGMTDGDTESLPDEASPLLLELASGSDPAEAGDYLLPDLTAWTFRLRAANNPTHYERAALSGGVDLWTGPAAEGAKFAQIGPDLIREVHHSLWLKNPSDPTPDSGSPAAEDRCCRVDLWIKYRADVDVVVVEGRLHNGACKMGDNPSSTPDTVDGEVNFLELLIEGKPAGWSYAWMRKHPLESVTSSIFSVWENRGTDYFLGTAAQRCFRFAMYRTTTSSKAQAEAVLRYQTYGYAVGKLGVTRVAAYGEQLAPKIDHGRAGFVGAQGQGAGWRGVREASRVRRDRMVTAYENGSSSELLSQRRGAYLVGGEPQDGGAAGGTGINGSSFCLPGDGYMETAWISLACCLNRTRNDMRDVETFQAMTARALAENNPNGLGMPYQFAMGDRQGTYRHPWFNEQSLSNFEILDASRTQMLRAPIRSWATPESGADPDESTIRGYDEYDGAHSARALEYLRDGWWAIRSPLAYVGWESYAATVTRAAPVFPIEGFGYQGSSFLYVRNNHGDWLDDLPVSESQRGFWRVNGLDQKSGNSRGLAWTMALLMGHFGIADDATRTALRGSGIEDDQLLPIPRLIEYCAMEWGLVWRTWTTNPSPNPYQSPAFPPTNVAERTGQYPGGPINGQPLFYSYGVRFHQDFIQGELAAFMRRCLDSRVPSLAFALERVLRFTEYQLGSSRNETQGQGGNAYPGYPIATTGSDPANDAPPDLATYVLGGTWWQLVENGSNVVGSKQINKTAWAAFAKAQRFPTEILEAIDLYLEGEGITGLTLSQAFEDLYRTGGGGSWIPATTGDNNNALYRNTGEQTFREPLLALMLNLLS